MFLDTRPGSTGSTCSQKFVASIKRKLYLQNFKIKSNFGNPDSSSIRISKIAEILNNACANFQIFIKWKSVISIVFFL